MCACLAGHIVQLHRCVFVLCSAAQSSVTVHLWLSHVCGYLCAYACATRCPHAVGGGHSAGAPVLCCGGAAGLCRSGPVRQARLTRTRSGGGRACSAACTGTVRSGNCGPAMRMRCLR